MNQKASRLISRGIQKPASDGFFRQEAGWMISMTFVV